MLRNYFTIAWRHLLKDRTSSLINISGLAIGMAVALLIGLWIWDELSYNTSFSHYDHIARVMEHQTYNGDISTDEAVSFPMGKELQTHYAGNFKYVVMSSWQVDHILSVSNRHLSQSGIYLDMDGPRMLSLKMLTGTQQGLQDPHSILLAASTAKAIFGDADPLYKTLKIDNKLDVKVTGIYEDLPDNTYFKNLAFIAPWELYTSSEPWIKRAETQWGNASFQLFVQIADASEFTRVSQNIIHSKYDNVPPDQKKWRSEIFLHPMRDWRLRSHWKGGVQTGGLIEYVRLFGIIGVFVLLLACINFMNLSTARSERRAKEVGIRKAIGSLRSQLIGQFYGESLVVIVFALFLSLLLVQLILPWFNLVTDKRLFVPVISPLFWLIAIAFTGFTAMVAGSYPALYLSSFQPIKVLKGSFKTGRQASIPRKFLVVLQFTISLTLIIGTIVVYNQIQYSKNRPIGYNRNDLMMVRMKSPDFYGKFDLLRNELKNLGAITELAESSSPPTDVWADYTGFEWAGKDPALEGDFGCMWVTPEFGQTVGWQIKEGRNFSREFRTDSLAILVNESSVKFMGLQHPVGTRVKWGAGPEAKTYTVIGVIKDMLMESPFDPVRQTIFFQDNENANWIDLKLNPNRPAAASLTKIEAVFKKYIPSAPFDYKFADRAFAAKFAAEERVGKLSTFFATLAIFISCLGLFGLASFVAEQRTKEIGVRKVLGASVVNLWRLLSTDLLWLVVLSMLIAIPTAWYFMNNWLQSYAYRTNISWWVFVVPAAGILLITLLTVSYQSIKAALANPVKSLRSE